MKNLIYIIVLFISNLGHLQAQFYNNGAVFTVQNNATLMVEGNFTNSQGSQFKNDGIVQIKGNITNNEVMTGPNTGSWKLIGTNLQTVSGVSQIWVKNLEINNAAGVMLNNITRVEGIIDFKNGLVSTSSIAFPLILSSLATVGNTTPVGDLNHVNGYISKEGLGPFIYPVGDATKYQPIQTNLTANSSGITAKYLPNDAIAGTFTNLGADPTPLTSYNNAEYWLVAPYLDGTATGTVSIFWDGYNDANPTGIANRKVAHKIGLNWQNEGNISSGNANVGAVTSNTLNIWSPFTLGFTTAAPLPLTLLEFTLKNTENGNQLNWKTSHEINTSHFEVEKSKNTKMFEKIGEVAAKNNAVEGNFNYNYIDKQSEEGIQFYRLNMIDIDGKFTYSKILSIENEVLEKDEIKIYPNPVADILYVENAKTNAIEISNILGQSSKYNLLKNNQVQSAVNVSSLPKGLYFMKVDGEVKKFLKE